MTITLKLKLFFALFALSLGGLLLFSDGASALNISVKMIDKTKIRIESVQATQNDWNNTRQNIKDSYNDSRSDFNNMLTREWAGVEFEDRDIWDDNHNWTAQSKEPPNCDGEIKYGGNASGGDFQDVAGNKINIYLHVPKAREAGTSRSCFEDAIDTIGATVIDYQNFYKVATWVDEGTITIYQRRDLVYRNSTDEPNIFRGVGGDDGCADRISLGNEGAAGVSSTVYTRGTWYLDASDQDINGCDTRGMPEALPNSGENAGNRTSQILIANVDRRTIPPGEGTVDPNSTENAGEFEPTCESQNPGVISWAMCGLVEFFDSVLSGLSNTVDELLNIDASYYEDDRLREAWSYFRNIASFLLIIIALVMIIGQAVSKE